MSKITKKLKRYIAAALAIMLTTSSILFSQEKLIPIFKSDFVHAILSGTLLITTLFWFFSYWHAVSHELDLLDSAFNSKQMTKTEGNAYIAMIGLSISFGCLLVLTPYIMWYAALAALLSSTDLYGNTTVSRNVSNLTIDQKFKEPNGENMAKILYDYYVRRPQATRIAIILITFCISFVLAFLGKEENNAAFTKSAYVVVIAAILFGELVIYLWRRERNIELEKLNEGFDDGN